MQHRGVTASASGSESESAAASGSASGGESATVALAVVVAVAGDAAEVGHRAVVMTAVVREAGTTMRR